MTQAMRGKAIIVGTLAVFAVGFCVYTWLRAAERAPAAASGLYKVVDGNKVDINTLQGWRTWRALACDRCHGPNQEGLVGPSLIAGMKVLNKGQFKKAVLEGNPVKGMPAMKDSKQVVENIDNLYAYLKGRSDGAIKPGRLEELK